MPSEGNFYSKTLQVASALGEERVVWTDNGIAPYSIDNMGVGKPENAASLRMQHALCYGCMIVRLVCRGEYLSMEMSSTHI